MTTIYLVRSKTQKDHRGYPLWLGDNVALEEWVPLTGMPYVSDETEVFDWNLPSDGEWVRFDSRPASPHKADPIPADDTATKELRLEEVKAFADVLQETFAKNLPEEPEPDYVDGEWHLFIRTDKWSGTIFGGLSGAWFYLWIHPRGMKKSGTWYEHELLHLTPEQGLNVLKILV